MLPSRGLRLLQHGRWSFGKRQFSSTKIIQTKSRIASPHSNSIILLAVSNLRPRIINTAPVVLLNGSILRFQSTIPSSPLATTVLPSPTLSPSGLVKEPAELVAATTNGSSFDFEVSEISNLPETIGYLKSLGLDYGWGPTAIVEFILEHIHVLAGTSWWASIALTAVLVRVVMFPLFVQAANNGAKMSKIKPLIDPLKQKTAMAYRAGDTQTVALVNQQLMAIRKKAGIKLIYSVAPIMQAFLGYGTWHLMRGMGTLPVPGWESGGILWFTNLAIPDPTYLLPAAGALVLYFTLKRGGEIGANSLISPEAMRVMSYLFPAISLLVVSFFPAGLQLSIFISATLSSLQAYMFSNPEIRAKLGMEPLPKNLEPSNLLETVFKMSGQEPPKSKAKTSTYIAPRPTQVQKRVVLQKSLRYEAPNSAAGSTGNSLGKVIKPRKPSLLESVKGGFRNRMDDVNTLRQGFQDRWGTTPEDEDKKEAERYEKMRRGQIDAQNELRTGRSKTRTKKRH